MTSGAIQCGVPMKVLRFDMVLVIWAATPKSATFTWPVSVTRMFPALMSRCSCNKELSLQLVLEDECLLTTASAHDLEDSAQQSCSQKVERQLRALFLLARALHLDSPVKVFSRDMYKSSIHSCFRAWSIVDARRVGAGKFCCYLANGMQVGQSSQSLAADVGNDLLIQWLIEVSLYEVRDAAAPTILHHYPELFFVPPTALHSARTSIIMPFNSHSITCIIA